MRRLRPEPYAEIQPVLIEVKPGGRPRYNVLRYKASAVPAEDTRVKETERSVSKPVRCLFIEIWAENANLRDGILCVSYFDPVGLRLRVWLQNTPKHIPAAPSPAGKAREQVLHHKTLNSRI